MPHNNYSLLHNTIILSILLLIKYVVYVLFHIYVPFALHILYSEFFKTANIIIGEKFRLHIFIGKKSC